MELDVGDRTVSYSPEIRRHEDITWASGEEEAVRAYLVCWLCTEGGYLPANLELEKPYSIGRPKAGAQLDILVKRPDGAPYALIEVKSPEAWEVQADKYIKGQLFGIAPHEVGASVLSWATVADGDQIAPRSTTIAYTGQSFEEWSRERAAGNEVPANYGEPVHEHYIRDGTRDLRQTVPQAELERLRKRLHDVLWHGSTPDNLIYEYVVKLFLAKIFDEKKTEAGAPYDFQRLYVGNTPESPRQMWGRIAQLYSDAYERYLNISGTDTPEPLNESVFSAEQTAFVVELLQGVALTSTDERGGDLLGGFFEGITREGFKQSKGLFFTHLNLAVFLLLVLDVPGLALKKVKSSAVHSERLPYIIDPSCGSGTFLLAAMHLVTAAVDEERAAIARNRDIREFLDDRFPATHPNRWAQDFIYGIEQSEVLAMSTKVNMVLHRDGNTHVYKADGLAPLRHYSDQMLKGGSHPEPSVYGKPVASAFDVVVTNPPFSITLDPATLDAAGSTFELAGSTNSENLFLERWYQLLRPGGRLGAVMPESFFATRENLQARLFLLDHFRIVAIVSLPRQAFEPWTPTRTSLLFAQKRSVREEKRWLAARVSAEAEVGAQQKALTKAIQDLTSVVTAMQADGTAVRAIAAARHARELLGESPAELPLAAPSDLRAVADDLDAAAAKWDGEKLDREAKKLLTILRRSTRALRSLVTKLDTQASAMQQAAEDLGVRAEPLDETAPLDTYAIRLRAWNAGAKRVHVAVWALRRIVEKFDYAFPVVSVEDIGFKRTRRAEYQRRNRLFTARRMVDGVRLEDETVPNLNLVEGRWAVINGDQAPDTALAQILAEISWD